MQSVEQEAKTFGAVNYVDSFFSNIPVDTRLNKVDYKTIRPSANDLTGTTFTLEGQQYPNCYLIGKTLLSLDVVIKNAVSGALPDAGETVAGSNNMLNSLFKTVNLIINDRQVEGTNEYHHYTSYIQTLLTYPDTTQKSWLMSSGFAKDVGEFNVKTNTGLQQRSAYFRKDMAMSGAYSNEGAHLIGYLMHPMHGVEKPLPPVTRVQFILIRTPDNVFIQRGETSGIDYKVEITNMTLHVPIVSLTESIGKELQLRHAREPIIYHYRNWVVTKVIIPSAPEWSSHQLFSDGRNPVRVYMCIVNDVSFAGSQTTSPFQFKRKWSVETKPVAQINPNKSKNSEEIENERYLHLSNQVSSILNVLAGMSNQSTSAACSSNQDHPGLVSTIVNKTAAYLTASVSSQSNSDESNQNSALLPAPNQIPDPTPAPEPNPTPAPTPAPMIVGAMETFHLTKFDLLVDETPFDGLSAASNQTENHCTNDFLRLFATNQQLGTLFSAPISYQDFIGGYHIVGFDLSSTGDGGCDAFVSPRVRLGNLILKLSL